MNGKQVSSKIWIKLRKKFSKIDIVVVKYSANKYGMSKPCSNCTKILKLVGVNNVYYTNNDGDIVKERVKNMETTHESQSAIYLKNIK